MVESGQETRAEAALRLEAIAWLTKLQSRADPRDPDAFQDWYSADPRHAEAFDSVVASWETTQLAARTPAAHARRHTSLPVRRGVRWPVALAAGLGAVFVVMAALGIHHVRKSGTVTVAQQDLVTRVGEIRTVTLADGSRVTLDAASTLDVRYSASERRVVLGQGRARFEVSRDPRRLFMVEAGQRLVIAHGTVFDVDLHGPSMTVSLLRGSIEIRQAGDQRGVAARPGITLAAGQRLSVADGTSPGTMIAFSAEDTAWPSGMLSFTNRPLGEIIDTSNRYNDQKIVLADRDLARLRFTATVAARDSMGLARLLEASFHLTLGRDASGTIVLSGATVPTGGGRT